MISTSGLNSPVALQLIDATRSSQLRLLKDSPVNLRAEEAFRSRISAIKTPEALIADFEVYSFVMRAFDLEDQIFGKGMIRKILESDPVEPSSLLNRLTDSRFRELHLSLGFTTEDGPQEPDFSADTFVEKVVERYYNRAFIISHSTENPIVGTVLEFREAAGEIGNWFDVLKSSELSTFFRTALGVPDAVAGLDLDRQVKILEERFDIAKLADPDEREAIVTRFIAISEASGPTRGSPAVAALNLIRSGNFGGQFVPFTFDVGMIGFSASRLYR